MLPGLRQLLKDARLVAPQQEVRETIYNSLWSTIFLPLGKGTRFIAGM